VVQSLLFFVLAFIEFYIITKIVGLNYIREYIIWACSAAFFCLFAYANKVLPKFKKIWMCATVPGYLTYETMKQKIEEVKEI
jgi:hypothetical protein